MHSGLHHAEKRKKEGRANTFDNFMIFVGIVGPLSLLPQVIQVWTAHDVTGVSLISWALLAVVACLWMVYGIARHSVALTINGALLALFDLLVVIGVLSFR